MLNCDLTLYYTLHYSTLSNWPSSKLSLSSLLLIKQIKLFLILFKVLATYNLLFEFFETHKITHHGRITIRRASSWRHFTMGTNVQHNHKQKLLVVVSFLLTYAYHSINLTFSLLSRFVCLLACLLKGPDGRVIFKAFLTHEFNLDLFQFWLDTEEYKKKSRKKRYLSKKIYFKYLQPGSEHEVNSCFISNCSWGQL